MAESKKKTAGQIAEESGLTIAQINELTHVSPQTLRNWSINKPRLYSVVIAGCVAISGGSDNSLTDFDVINRRFITR